MTRSFNHSLLALQQRVSELEGQLPQLDAAGVTVLVALRHQLVQLEHAKVDWQHKRTVFAKPWALVLIPAVLGVAGGIGSFVLASIKDARSEANQIAREREAAFEQRLVSDRDAHFKVLDFIADNRQLLFQCVAGTANERQVLLSTLSVIASAEVIQPVLTRLNATVCGVAKDEVITAQAKVGLLNPQTLKVTVLWAESKDGAARDAVEKDLRARLVDWGVDPVNTVFKAADSTPPSRSEVRYYFAGDESNATILRDTLSSAFPDAFRDLRVNPHSSNSVHPINTLRLYLHVRSS